MRLDYGHLAPGGGGAEAKPAGALRIALQRVAFGPPGLDPGGVPTGPPLALLGAATGLREYQGLWRGAPPRLQLADDAVILPEQRDATAQTIAFDPGAVLLGVESDRTSGSRRESLPALRRTSQRAAQGTGLETGLETGQNGGLHGRWLDRLTDVGKRVGASAGQGPVRILWIDEARDAAATLLQSGAADVVVRGEADETLPSIVQGAIAGRSDWSGTRGVSWLTGGEIRHEREGATPLHIATPAWDLVDLASYPMAAEAGWLRGPRLAALSQRLVGRRLVGRRRDREATIFTMRSCPPDCPTCHGSFGSHGRQRPVGEIVQEIRTLVQKHRVRSLRIGDMSFDGDSGRAEAIALAIAKLRSAPGFGYLTLSFPRGLRGDGLTPSLIEALIRAGATTLPLRVTTASPRLQRLLKENIHLARVDAALAEIADRGARGHLLMRLGLPTETVGEVAHTIRWARRSQAATADFESGRQVDLGPAWTSEQPGDIDDFPSLRRRALTSFYSSPSRASRLARSLPGSLASSLSHSLSQVVQRRF